MIHQIVSFGLTIATVGRHNVSIRKIVTHFMARKYSSTQRKGCTIRNLPYRYNIVFIDFKYIRMRNVSTLNGHRVGFNLQGLSPARQDIKTGVPVAT